jgi:hypothetical protein
MDGWEYMTINLCELPRRHRTCSTTPAKRVGSSSLISNGMAHLKRPTGTATPAQAPARRSARKAEPSSYRERAGLRASTDGEFAWGARATAEVAGFTRRPGQLQGNGRAPLHGVLPAVKSLMNRFAVNGASPLRARPCRSTCRAADSSAGDRFGKGAGNLKQDAFAFRVGCVIGKCARLPRPVLPLLLGVPRLPSRARHSRCLMTARAALFNVSTSLRHGRRGASFVEQAFSQVENGGSSSPVPFLAAFFAFLVVGK